MATSEENLSDGDFDALTSLVLAHVERQLDAWLQEDVVDIDSGRSGGMLELVFPDRSKIVINTQPPLHELWLAARGGGHHFRWTQRQWLDTKTGQEFFSLLSQHTSAQAGLSLAFVPPSPPASIAGSEASR